MNIIVRSLGSVSGDGNSKIKFILLEDGTLLYGKCQWHKDLAVAAGIDEAVKVVGAGVIPANLMEAGIKDDVWGNWKSTGYGVLTPETLREEIAAALVSCKKEIDYLQN